MSEERGSVSDRLALAAGILLFVVLPVVMVVANRATAAILAFACSIMLVARLLDARRHDLFSQGAGVFLRPVVLLFIAFFLLALAGIPGTAHAKFHLWRLGEAFIPVATTALLLHILPTRNLVLRFPLLVLGLLLASALIFIEIAHPGFVRRLFSVRQEVFRLNRALVTLVMLLPILGVLAETWRERLLALFVSLVVAIAAFKSESATSGLAVLVIGVVTVLAWLNWTWVSRLVLSGTLLTIAVAPFHGQIFKTLIPDALHQTLSSASSAIRVKIYSAFEAAISAAPIFGSGFNSASRYRNEPGFQRIPPDLQSYVEFGHPHNAALQLWLEMGLVGALIVCALALFAFRALNNLPERMRPFALGFWAAVVAVATVSHGAWQAWWLALVGIGLVLFSARAHEIRASRDRA
jgi:O-antigen ligase